MYSFAIIRVLQLLIIYLLCFPKSVAETPKPFKKICHGQLEISFFASLKKFPAAKQACVEYGGRLVKVDSAAIQKAIENALGKPDGQRYYIGGEQPSQDDNFMWVADGTKVGENGYTNWKSNQPNNLLNEDCMGIGDHEQYQWTDVMCTVAGADSRFICQKEVRLHTRVKDKNFICQSVVPEVAVKWTRNSKLITTTKNTDGVYQNISSDRSVLMLENANISLSETYTCVGYAYCLTKRQDIKVTVDGTPTIKKIENNKCNSSLFVTWKPNKAAMGFPHRISAIHDTNLIWFEIPRSHEVHLTKITGLVSGTLYTVEIKACLTEESCDTGFGAESRFKTNGITDPVSTALLVEDAKGGCKASWWPPGQDKIFAVTMNCTFENSRDSDGRGFIIQKINGLKGISFQFQPSPNQRCEALVQVKGCEEFSIPVKANGVCVTSVKEPAYVKPPQLFDASNGNAKLMKLLTPSEDNGLISCVFLIICYKNCGHKNFTIEDLKTANKTVAKNLNGDVHAIAIAIPMSQLLLPIGPLVPSAHYFELFNGNITKCNVHNTTTSNSTDAPHGNFHAQNLIADNSTNVGAFLVTATPSNGEVFLKSSPVVIIQNNTSEVVTVQNETKGNKTETSEPPSGDGLNAGLTVGVGIIGLVIGAVSLYAFMWLRQRGAKPKDENSLEKNTSDQARTTRTSIVQQEDRTPCNYENYPDTPAYEEITAGNKGSSTYESYNA